MTWHAEPHVDAALPLQSIIFSIRRPRWGLVPHPKRLFSSRFEMLTLAALPYEVLSYIVGEIDFDDAFNLGQTCKALQFLLTEERICKSILQVRSCAHIVPLRILAYQ
jgi:hypothetical protein